MQIPSSKFRAYSLTLPYEYGLLDFGLHDLALHVYFKQTCFITTPLKKGSHYLQLHDGAVHLLYRFK